MTNSSKINCLGRLAPIFVVCCGPACTYGDDALLTEIRAESNTVIISGVFPDSFTNHLDVYVRTNLLTGAWSLASEGVSAWTNDAEGMDISRYFMIGDGDRDTDLDSIPDAREQLLYGTRSDNSDSDADGLSDAEEIASGSSPLDQLAVSGVNRSWLFYNNTDYSSSSWELAPGTGYRFLTVNYDAGMNTIYLLTPPNLTLGEGEEARIRLRTAYEDPMNPGTWLENYYSASFLESVALDSGDAFHGVPQIGKVNLDLYKISWPQPTNTESLTVYYSILIEALTDGTTNDYVYLLKGGSSCVSNNWEEGPQYYGADYVDQDYIFLYDPTRLENGDFETGSPSSATNIPSWQPWGTDVGLSTNIARNASSYAFRSESWYGVLYQNFAAYPGEQLLISCHMFYPSATNAFDPHPLEGNQRGRATLEYYDQYGDLISSQEALLTTNFASEMWHPFVITSVVPDLAQSANIALRVDDAGNGHVYFDDLSVAGSNDADQDGMPDDWENLFPDILDNTNDEDNIDDPDQDGLSNLDEFRIGSNPSLEDTDNDGLIDGWEVEYDLDPLSADDAVLDFDGDGLSNYEEFLMGADPLTADSDEDGVSDSFEQVYTSDPLSSNAWEYILLQTIEGSNTISRLGPWSEDGSELYAESRRGFLEYALNTEEADMYRIEIEGADQNNYEEGRDFILRVYVDDEYIEKLIFRSESLNYTTVSCFTPWLAAGTHTLRIDWDNAADEESLRIKEIRFMQLTGADSDDDGQKDWVENLLDQQCSLEINTTNYVSPICAEGASRYFGMMSLSDGHTPHHGLGDRWYADIPLSPTTTTSFVCSFQGGARTITGQVEWTALNLLDAGNQMLRAGDSLLLTAFPVDADDGQVTVTVDDLTYPPTDVETSIPHCFGTSGTYVVTGTYQPLAGETQSGSITVTVVSASFGDTPACWIGYARTWECSNISSNVFIETDSDVALQEQEPPESGGRQFEVEMFDNETRYAVARLYENGPIVAQTPLQGFHLLSEEQTYVHLEETYADGSELIETVVVASPLPDDVEYNVEIYVSGIVMDDGGLTRDFSASDFNELGEYTLRFLREEDTDTSICHRLSAFQEDKKLGSR